jgi:hypothetical protein
MAFLAGERLGAVTLLPPLTQSLLRLSIGWALALVILSAVTPQGAPELAHAANRPMSRSGQPS